MARVKELVVTTPEKIYFNYRVADFGTRIAAYIVDFFIQIIIILLLYILFFAAMSLSIPDVFTGRENPALVLAVSFMLIIDFILKWFYFVIFEVITEGQSPGKKLMKIRVIKEDGTNLDFQTIVLRNFLRVIDGFPMVPLLGGFICLIDKKTRRLGDMVAGTMVVYEILYKLNIPDFEIKFSNNREVLKKRNIARKLNENELYILRRFLNEKHKLPPEKEREIAFNLANEIKEKLGLTEEIKDPVLFIEEIYKEHGI